MIVFRQKEYSSWLTKLSYELEKLKKYNLDNKIGELKRKSELISDINPNENNKIKRRIRLIKAQHPKQSEIQIKKDAIKTREEIKDYSKNPKRVLKEVSKVVDNKIYRAIRKPKDTVVKVAKKIPDPTIRFVTTLSDDLYDVVSAAAKTKKINGKSMTRQILNNTAQKYRGTNFSKRLGGRIK